MLKTIDLTGKRALITGAGGGIGRAIALRLAESGMKLALAGRDAGKLMRTAALTGRPLDMLVLPADLTTQKGIDDVMHILEGHFKGLDVLINNAGMALNRPFEETTLEEYDRIMHESRRARPSSTSARWCPTRATRGSRPTRPRSTRCWACRRHWRRRWPRRASGCT